MIDITKKEVAFIYNEKLPTSIADDFSKIMQETKIDLFVCKQKDKGPIAAIGWLITSTIAIMILQPYLKSFFGEMGKDHYKYLKKGIANVGKKLFGKNKVINIKTITGSNSPKKKPENYTNHFSIMLEVKPKLYFKFIFKKNISFKEFSIANKAITTFIEECMTDNNLILKTLEKNKNIIYSNNLILSYDYNNKEIISLNPLGKNKYDKI